jgi:hypothetical protein
MLTMQLSMSLLPRITVLIQGFVITAVATLSPAVASEIVTHWAPPRISSPQFESHAAFDPLTGDLLFVRSSKQFRGWRILASHCGPRGWTQPRPAAFAAPGLEADPFFTADGRWLYFISTRASGSSNSQDLDIWRIERDDAGRWGTPERLPAPVNSPGAEWFPRPALDGWLYFGSDRPGGQGKTDIWRARTDDKGQWHVENLGSSVNGPGSEYEALPSPDGKHLIVEADEGYFESDRLATGWSPRRRLGPAINGNGSEIGAVFSPSGRSLLFARDIKGSNSGEFFVWQPDGPEDWPPSCPQLKSSAQPRG